MQADQSPENGGPASLQEKTVTRIKRRYHEEESPEAEITEQSLETEQGTDTSRMAHGESVHAVYEREEISGPLGSAGVDKSVEVEEVSKYKPSTPAK